MFRALLHHKPAFIGFVAFLLLGVIARYLNGSLYDEAEVLQLYETLKASGLYLGSAIATGSATTLALMLTMVGLVRRLDADFGPETYQSVALVGFASSVNLVASVLLLLMLTLPFGEFENVPDGWFTLLYNIVFAIVVFVCAASVAVVLILLSTVLAVVRNVTPEFNET